MNSEPLLADAAGSLLWNCLANPSSNGHALRSMTERPYAATFDSEGNVRLKSSDNGNELAARVFLDDKPITDAFWTSLTPRLADFGDVAVAIYTTDRLCRRPRSNDSFDWGRTIQLEVPVREPSFWSDGVLTKSISKLLAHISDDDWQLRFVRRRGEARQSEAPTLFSNPIPHPASAALFSGGLDSLGGLTSFLEANSSFHVALFCAQTGRRVGAAQRALLNGLLAKYPKRLHIAKASFGFRRRIAHTFDQEDRSQRTRGFAFQALGIIAATLAGSSELQVFENGIGAINLPYLDSQLGSQATRATSPLTLRLMSDLATAVLEAPFRIRLPFILHTKSQLCKTIRAAALEHLIAESISCDHFPQRVAGKDHCGACSSCLLRRQALFCAGLESADRRSYVHTDIGRGPGPKGTGWFVLHAMDWQVARLERALTSNNPGSMLLETFPALAHSYASLEESGISLQDITELYSRYVQEWRFFRQNRISNVGSTA